jgi:hypothetical protein
MTNSWVEAFNTSEDRHKDPSFVNALLEPHGADALAISIEEGPPSVSVFRLTSYRTLVCETCGGRAGGEQRCPRCDGWGVRIGEVQLEEIATGREVVR